jgi:hypothetical protein
MREAYAQQLSQVREACNAQRTCAKPKPNNSLSCAKPATYIAVAQSLPPTPQSGARSLKLEARLREAYLQPSRQVPLLTFNAPMPISPETGRKRHIEA